MTEKRAMPMFAHWRASAEKLDYFILGICAGLSGYLGTHYEPSALGINPSSAELISLLLFGSATAAGLMRLRNGVAYWGAQYLFIESAEKGAQLKTLLASGTGLAIIDASGDVISRDQAAEKASDLVARAEAAEAERAKWKPRFEVWYNVRDRLLVAGIVFYLGSKLWAAALAS